MNKFKAIFKGKSIIVEAASSYKAQQAAAEVFKTKKPWEIALMAVMVDGKEVIHSTAAL